MQAFKDYIIFCPTSLPMLLLSTVYTMSTQRTYWTWAWIFACRLKHLVWHLIVSPLMIHCLTMQTSIAYLHREAHKITFYIFTSLDAHCHSDGHEVKFQCKKRRKSSIGTLFKKIWDFFQMSPPPLPPFWNPSYQKQKKSWLLKKIGEFFGWIYGFLRAIFFKNNGFGNWDDPPPLWELSFLDSVPLRLMARYSLQLHEHIYLGVNFSVKPILFILTALPILIQS